MSATPLYWREEARPSASLADRRVRSTCCDRPMVAEDVHCPECRQDQRTIDGQPNIHYPKPGEGTTTP